MSSILTQTYETGSYLARRLAVVAVGVVWCAFWLAVVRIHLLQGAYVDAGVTLLLTLAPVVAAVGTAVPSVGIPELGLFGSQGATAESS